MRGRVINADLVYYRLLNRPGPCARARCTDARLERRSDGSRSRDGQRHRRHRPVVRASAVRQAEAQFGSIDVLVNNAGYGYRGAVEEASEAEIRQLFETNFFGLVAMTKAVLPTMRAKGSGHIVNISSVGGRMAQPGSGYYSPTKFAVEGMSDALRKELRPLGIGVTVVEPGGFRTDFAGRSLRQSTRTIADYATTAGPRRKENITNDGRQPGDPARAARAIIKAIEAEVPPFRLVLGRTAVRRIHEEMLAQLLEIDAWEKTANGADYPDAT
jgi:NAD(P)-dependent dehydrogenase (short-subunit alcohol dehydrogenase family)